MGFAGQDVVAPIAGAVVPPLTEGVVLKRTDSRLIGSTRGCEDNRGWLKVKWRDGSASCTRTKRPRYCG